MSKRILLLQGTTSKCKVSKLNYFGFGILLLIIFIVALFPSHNLVDTPLIEKPVEEKELPFNFSEPSVVADRIFHLGSQASGDFNYDSSLNRITHKQLLNLTDLLERALADSSNYYKTKNYDYAYSSLWYFTAVQYLTLDYSFENCITASLERSSKYNKFLFYMPDHYKKELDVLSGRLESFKKEAVRWNPRYLDSNNREEIIGNVNNFWRNRNNYYKDSEDRCQPLKTALIEDYGNQKTLLFYRLAVLLIILVSLFLLWKIKVIGENSKSTKFWNNLKNLFKNFWQEISTNYVRSGTVKAILKLNSFVTVLITILSILVRDFNVRNATFIIIIIGCAITLLLSSIFGVISINNPLSNFGVWSYRLALISLLFFIVFIGYIVFLLIVSNIVSAVVETTKIALNSTKEALNSTVSV